jgi:serine/threonine-protein kinase
MAYVYRAVDLTLDRTVAVKVVRPEYSAGNAFIHEARAIAKLPHPNIVTVHDAVQDGDLQYIVMEYIDGQDLKQWIKSDAPMRIGRALDILVQICTAVGYAHDKGILHCDLKPQNVLVLPNDQVKVTDFGIARALSATSTQPRSKAWGTPHYAPPELVAGTALTPASDQYAIGVILYEMLAGKPPFEGQTAVEIARQHALSAPPPIRRDNPRIPRYLEQILDRTLAKDPAKRYPTVKQLGKLLASYRQRGEAITQPLPTVPATTAAVQTAPPRNATGGQSAGQQPLHTPGPLVPQRRSRLDWIALLLAATAFVAIMGLVPLWGTVITRALEQPPAATATPVSAVLPTLTLPARTIVPPATPTPVPLVAVPDLAGAELQSARQHAAQQGFGLRVGEERYDHEIPASHVLAQSPLPAERVPLGTEIAVVISLGPKLVTMPEVVGFPVSIKQLDLEDLELVVTITETASAEPAGLIVFQSPPAGTEIRAGTTVTLTISTGAYADIRANLGDQLLLQSSVLNRPSFRPGETAQLTLRWRVLNRLSEPYTTFIHATDPTGRIVAQLDRPPLNGQRPTNTWQVGEEISDPYDLFMPQDMPQGTYAIWVGLYRDGRRLTVVDSGLAVAKDDAILVHQITVAD